MLNVHEVLKTPGQRIKVCYNTYTNEQASLVAAWHRENGSSHAARERSCLRAVVLQVNSYQRLVSGRPNVGRLLLCVCGCDVGRDGRELTHETREGGRL